MAQMTSHYSAPLSQLSWRGGSRRTSVISRVSLCAALLCLCMDALALTYSESVDGEFSSDPTAPTRLVLDYGPAPGGGPLGSNIITGTIGRSLTSNVLDLDYFTVTVPTGYVLSQLRLGNQTTVGGNGSFLGVAVGGNMPVLPTAIDATGLLGWRVYFLADRNTDILPLIGSAGQGAAGFSGALLAGDYTFWLQELARGSYTYRFNFVLSPVPEPSVLWMLLAGVGLLVLVAPRPGDRRHAGTFANNSTFSRFT